MTNEQTELTEFPTISIWSILSQNMSVIVGQALWAIYVLSDTFFLSQLGGDAIYEYSFVQSINILITSMMVGMMQSFLIFGPRDLFVGDCKKYQTTFISILALVFLVSLLLQSLLAGALVWLSATTDMIPQQASVYAVHVIPGMVLLALVGVLRFKFIVENARGLFILLSAAACVFKFGAIAVLLQFPDFVPERPEVKLTLLQVGVAVLILIVAYVLALFSHAIRLSEVIAKDVRPRMSSLLVVGVPIGIVVCVEYLTFSSAQYIVSLKYPQDAEYFALAMQLLLAIEIIAVALAQVVTTRFAATADRGQAHLMSLSRLSGGIALVVLAGFGLAIAAAAPWLAGYIYASDPTKGAVHVQRLTDNFYIVAGIQVLLGGVVVLAGMLRGLGDIKRPLVLLFLNYGVLGVGTIVVLINITDLREFAAWIGIGVCLVSSIAFLSVRLVNQIKDDIHDD